MDSLLAVLTYLMSLMDSLIAVLTYLMNITWSFDHTYVHEFVNETSLYNHIVLTHLLPRTMWQSLPHFIQTWLRNYLTGLVLYFLSGFLWCLFIYYIKVNVYILKEAIPTRQAMFQQICVAMKAMPCYSLLPTVSEHMIERGWTMCYSTLDQSNLFMCFINIFLYLVLVEIGVYFIHKKLHEIKLFYKHVHSIHHIYNKENTISPFAGFAFHPLDGIIQGSPHVISTFIVPVHLKTHLILMAMEGLWAANIHDCIHGNIWPIMGGGYHTIHHITYKHNYGHKTICMDWIFGSLKSPLPEEVSSEKKAI